MNTPIRFPYTAAPHLTGEMACRPLLPIALENGGNMVPMNALLDTGASVGVLPYSVGLQLGLAWGQQAIAFNLTGNLAQFPARAIVLSATVGRFTPVRLAFAWTQTDSTPVILGKVNFFMEFDVCFFRAQREFEVVPRVVP